MAEYIDRKALGIGKCNPEIFDDKGYANGWNAALDIIQSAPAADVRPVVRGKWVNDHNGKYSASGDNFFCSICKDPSLRAFGKPAKTNYCPNCGARMEG